MLSSSLQSWFRRARVGLVVAGFLISITAGRLEAQGSAAPLLITAEWLAQHLNDANLVILHVGPMSEYAGEHIPGAHFVGLSDISAGEDQEKGGLALQVPSADVLREKLASLGISDNSRIVVDYAKDWITPSTRVVFTLDYAGLGGRTSLLDGGLNAWKGAGKPVTAEAKALKKGSLSAIRIRPIVVDAEWVKANVEKPGISVVDGRAAAFYDGVQSGMSRSGKQRTGHIAGAKSVPYTEIATDALLFKSPAELRALFTKAGVKEGDTVVGYCHIGQQATGMLFAARLLGHKVMLYDGSFEDWSARGAAYPVSVSPAK